MSTKSRREATEWKECTNPPLGAGDRGGYGPGAISGCGTGSAAPGGDHGPRRRSGSSGGWGPMTWAVLVIAVLLLWRHRGNIERLLAGNERRISLPKRS